MGEATNLLYNQRRLVRLGLSYLRLCDDWVEGEREVYPMLKYRMLLLVAALSLTAAENQALLSKQDLIKKKLSRMEGMVTDLGKFPIADAAVTVQRMEDSVNAPARLELKTAEDGRFLLDSLAPGKYEVLAAHKGFKSTTKQFVLVPGKVTKAIVSLSLTFRLCSRSRRGSL